MAKILVLYYSLYGNTKNLAQSIAEGARSVSGSEVFLKRVPEIMPQDVFERSGGRKDDTQIAQPQELAEYDAIIFGTPTRFGNVSSQMRNFMDQTGMLWMRGSLIGKIGSVFGCTGSRQGNETTFKSFHSELFHHGMVLVGLPSSCPHFKDTSVGGSAYGVTSYTGADGKRMVDEKEKEMAIFQGKHVTELAKRLFG